MSARIPSLVLAGLLACAPGIAAPAAAAAGTAARQAQHDLAATRRHYAALLAGPAPRLAELALFTSLMPKGGDLHHHYSGAIYAETYLDWLEQAQGCVFGATDKALGIEKFRVAMPPQVLAPEAQALCLPVDVVRKDNGFLRELLQRWSDKDFDNHHHEQPAPDQQFFDTFGYFGPVSGAAYRRGLLQLKARALAENVGYLETMLRGAPLAEHPGPETLAALAALNALGPGPEAAPRDAAFARALEALTHDAAVAAAIELYLAQLDEATDGLDDDQFRLRLQTYVTRGGPPATVFAQMVAGFIACTRNPRLVGLNIVGPENGVVAMRDYALHMRMLAFLKSHFPPVPLALHAGELVLGMVPPEGLRSHIREAVEVAGAARIGHGVDIPLEEDAPELLATMRRRDVAVEINLSSNAFILGVQAAAHPLPLYRRFGVPFVISTDDAGVSRNNLSGEYLLYVSRYRPGYDELKRVVGDSIRHAFLSPADRRDELARLARRFAAFEHRIAGLPAPR